MHTIPEEFDAFLSLKQAFLRTGFRGLFWLLDLSAWVSSSFYRKPLLTLQGPALHTCSSFLRLTQPKYCIQGPYCLTRLQGLFCSERTFHRILCKVKKSPKQGWLVAPVLCSDPADLCPRQECHRTACSTPQLCGPSRSDVQLLCVGAKLPRTISGVFHAWLQRAWIYWFSYRIQLTLWL